MSIVIEDTTLKANGVVTRHGIDIFNGAKGDRVVGVDLGDGQAAFFGIWKGGERIVVVDNECSDKTKSDTLAALNRAMIAWPHLRVGQLLFNAIESCPDTEGRDLFYITNGELLKALNYFWKKGG